MRTKKILTSSLVSFFILAAVATGQNKPMPSEPAKLLVPYKIDVVFKEYKGTKELSSLPYTVSGIATDQSPAMSHFRMGLNVPIATGSYGIPTKGGSPSASDLAFTNTQFSYKNVGTNIDYRGKTLGGGLFEVSLIADRSSLSPTGTAEPMLGGIAPHQPMFASFSTSLDLVMRNGQTIESTVATDPIRGLVIKVDVTLHVMKEQ
ncbi:MAG: hypothetical protein ACRD2P_06685 [Terriglobia bacterium]